MHSKIKDVIYIVAWCVILAIVARNASLMLGWDRWLVYIVLCIAARRAGLFERTPKRAGSVW